MTIETFYEPKPPRPVIPFELPAVPLPDGVAPHDIVPEQDEVIKNLKAEAQRVQLAPHSLDEKLARAKASLEAARGGPIVPDLQADGTADFRSAFAPYSGAVGGQVFVPDPIRVLLADVATFERMLAHAESTIKERHKGIKNALSAEDKKKRRRELAAAILAAERLQCAAIWAARASGHDIAFRVDADPRAVLGINGPPIRKRQ